MTDPRRLNASHGEAKPFEEREEIELRQTPQYMKREVKAQMRHKRGNNLDIKDLSMFDETE